MSIVKLHNQERHLQARIDLAAVFRMAYRYNWYEGIANHFSFAVSDNGKEFLINPNGRHFSLIKASELLLLNAEDSSTMDREEDAPDPTAWAIHSAMHRQVPHACCVLHVHSTYATILSTLKDKTLPPIDQNTCRFYNRVAIDDGFGGMGLGDEAERLPTVFKDKPILLMGSHGIMVTAPSIALAFDELYHFERSCETYIKALMTGKELDILSHEIAEATMQQWLNYNGNGQKYANKLLDECKQILNKEEPDYID